MNTLRLLIALVALNSCVAGEEFELNKTLDAIRMKIGGKSYWDVDNAIRSEFSISKTLAWKMTEDKNTADYHWNIKDSSHCIEASFDISGKYISIQLKRRPTISDFTHMLKSKSEYIEKLLMFSKSLDEYDPVKTKHIANYFIKIGEKDFKMALNDYLRINHILMEGDDRMILLLTILLYGKNSSLSHFDKSSFGGRPDLVAHSLVVKTYPIYLKNDWPILLERSGDCVRKYNLKGDVDAIIMNGSYRLTNFSNDELFEKDDPLIDALPNDCRKFVQKQFCLIRSAIVATQQGTTTQK